MPLFVEECEQTQGRREIVFFVMCHEVVTAVERLGAGGRFELGGLHGPLHDGEAAL